MLKGVGVHDDDGGSAGAMEDADDGPIIVGLGGGVVLLLGRGCGGCGCGCGYGGGAGGHVRDAEGDVCDAAALDGFDGRVVYGEVVAGCARHGGGEDAEDGGEGEGGDPCAGMRSHLRVLAGDSALSNCGDV
jgi:hypothetical protein